MVSRSDCFPDCDMQHTMACAISLFKGSNSRFSYASDMHSAGLMCKSRHWILLSCCCHIHTLMELLNHHKGCQPPSSSSHVCLTGLLLTLHYVVMKPPQPPYVLPQHCCEPQHAVPGCCSLQHVLYLRCAHTSSLGCSNGAIWHLFCTPLGAFFSFHHMRYIPVVHHSNLITHVCAVAGGVLDQD